MSLFIIFPLLFTPLFAAPSAGPDDSANTTLISSNIEARGIPDEWTSWGDSYSTGVGVNKYLGGGRCLRYDRSYPEQMAADADKIFPDDKSGDWNFAACSGAKTEDILAHQFYEKGKVPYSFQYGWNSPGTPKMGVLTVGGDDIDFPGILQNCIIGSFPVAIGEQLSCEDQRKKSWALISTGGDITKPNPDLIEKVRTVIDKILKYSQPNAPKFRLYVTGYGQFFNAKTDYCSTHNFKRVADKPKDDNLYLTQGLRQIFNQMSLTLNEAIKEAVGKFTADDRVTYIDIDGFLDGHRFCEEGIKEPDLNNQKLYFMHYPYKQDTDTPGITYLNNLAQQKVSSLNYDANTRYVDLVDRFWSMVNDQDLLNAVGAKDANSPEMQGLWDSIGYRARVFHPAEAFHELIYEAVANKWRSDKASDNMPAPVATSSASAPAIATSAAPAPAYATGTCTMHINEYQAPCLSMDKNLNAEITIWDANQQQIGHTDKVNGVWPGINAGASLFMQSKLPQPLVVTGEHAGDYIQFTIGDLSFKSTDDQATSPNGWCHPGGWDPRDGSACLRIGSVTAKNQIDCHFKC